MSSYLLSVYNPADSHEREFGPYNSAADMEAAFARTGEFNEKLQKSGALIAVDGLGSPALGVTVNPDGTLIQGPAFQAEYYLGGFWIIRAADLAEATAIAQEASAACGGRIEVRKMESSGE